MNKIKTLIEFLNTDIWRIRMRQVKGQKSFWLNQLRIILLSIRGFDEDKCLLRASALTFYSLISIVPVVAMAFGVAKGFGFQNKLEQELLEKFASQGEVVVRIIDFAKVMLENTQGGVIAGVGVAFLFWAIIKVLGNIEQAFNGIWGVQQGRTLVRKFSDYLSIMLICPMLLIMSSSMTVIITSQVTLIVDKLSFLGPLADLILYALKVLPYCVMWGLFTFLYIFMPNTKVRFKSALFAGIIAGTIYQVVQWAYITFQIGAAKYGAIYGSFAALPLFLIWLQISWLIVLFGAEMSFAEQNVDTYEFEPDSKKASARFRKFCALCMVQICVKRFIKGDAPLTAEAIARELEMPIRLVNVILYDLTKAGVLLEVKIENSTVTAFAPARNTQDLTIANVIHMIDVSGVDNIPFNLSDDAKKLKNLMEKIEQSTLTSEQNVLISDL